MTSQLYSKQAQQLAILEQRQALTAGMLTELLSLVKNGSGPSGNVASKSEISIVSGGPESMARMKSVRFNDALSMDVGFIPKSSSLTNIVPSLTESVHSMVSPVNNSIGPVNSIDRPVFPNVTTHDHSRPTNLTSGFANPPMDPWEQRQTTNQSKQQTNAHSSHS